MLENFLFGFELLERIVFKSAVFSLAESRSQYMHGVTFVILLCDLQTLGGYLTDHLLFLYCANL